MKQALIDLLRAVEKAIPPPKNCHHALVAAKFGSDEVGWQDKLALQVNRDGRFHAFFLDEEDFAKEPKKLAADILALLDEPGDPQFGVGLGQFIVENES
jgi:hypothetical protein